jgi:2-isopropylmalate synthase
VNVEQRVNAVGDQVTVSMAVVKVTVGDEKLILAAEGSPVNALDLALRKDLSKYQIYIRGSISPTIACASPTLAPRP